MELFLPMCAFTDLKSNPKSFIQIRYVQSFFMGSTNGWARYKKLCTLQGLSVIVSSKYKSRYLTRKNSREQLRWHWTPDELFTKADLDFKEAYPNGLLKDVAEEISGAN